MVLSESKDKIVKGYLLGLTTSIWSAILINMNTQSIYVMQFSEQFSLFFTHLVFVLAICFGVAIFAKLISKLTYSESVGYVGCLYLLNCFREHFGVFTDSPFGYLL